MCNRQRLYGKTCFMEMFDDIMIMINHLDLEI